MELGDDYLDDSCGVVDGAIILGSHIKWMSRDNAIVFSLFSVKRMNVDVDSKCRCVRRMDV